MRNDISKFFSLTLSSMIFFTSTLAPAYASKTHTKKKIFSDNSALTEHLRFEKESNPNPVNKYRIYRELSNLGKKVYKTDLFNVHKTYLADLYSMNELSKNLFDIDICTGITYRGIEPCDSLKKFKEAINEFCFLPSDDNTYMPLNVVVYLCAYNIIRDLDNEVNLERYYDLKWWKTCNMDFKLLELNEANYALFDLIQDENNENLLLKFQCNVEMIIKSLLEVRAFFSLLPLKLQKEWGVNNKDYNEYGDKVDNALAMFWYIDQTVCE